jgi:hypothetical protein
MVPARRPESQHDGQAERVAEVLPAGHPVARVEAEDSPSRVGSVPTPGRTIEALSQGKAGEELARGYLHSIGFSLATPEPDLFGTDVLATTWAHDRAYPRHLVYYFQVKTRSKGIVRGVDDVRRSLLFRACRNPALVLVSDGDQYQPRRWFCSVFAWMKEHPDWALGDRKTVTIQPEFFVLVRREHDARERLFPLLQAEADRFADASPWRSMFSPLTALDLQDVFELIGMLRHVEPSSPLIQWVQHSVPSPTDLIVAQRLRTLRSDPAERDAAAAKGAPIRRLWTTWPPAASRAEVRRDAETVRQFFRSFDRWLRGERPRLPPYSYHETAVWRVLLEIWPAAAGMVWNALVEQVDAVRSGRGGSPDAINSALNLLGSIAYSRDGGIADKAREVLLKLEPEIRISDAGASRLRYEFQHALLYGLAQAMPGYSARCMELLHKEGSRNRRELDLNARYYRCEDDTLPREAVLAKIAHPRARDERMVPILGLQLDMVTRYGLFRRR